ncbi:MAG: TonB-dependent receptor [Flavobacteriaceae bacterium]
MNVKKLKSSIVLLLCLSAVTAFAQVSVTGTINDQSGVPLGGVNVILQGTSKGTVSDFDGNFSIENVEAGTYTVTASYVGFKTYTKSITVADTDITLNFVMDEDAESLDEVIVTGVVNPRSKIESSVSVTSMRAKAIEQSAPRSTAEIFRTIPGIRSESSGGEGNANIAVRGVPISSGGSKYVQLQEDGLPILLYGDISFATADIFSRFDYNVSRIEAIRGGSASTLTSNAPGGIINIISKTGTDEGGAIGTTFGLDYNTFRTDFDYGSKIGNGLYFHTGGFYRVGEGIRDVGFTANNGGQFKISLTKEFENGKIRVYGKYLNDNTAAYLPMPMKVTGTNSNPDWGNAPNFDATTGSLHTANLLQTVGLGGNGELRRGDVKDGMHPISASVGMEANFDLGSNWKVTNNGRFSMNSGTFISPFPSEVAAASSIANSFGTGTTLQYTDGTAVASDALVSKVIMFDVELNNLNNFMNDFKLTKKFDNFNITLGYFKSIQNISMSWLWSSYLQDVNDDNAKLINAYDATGAALTENGLWAYGTPDWGNLHRNYDTQYNVSAPYFNVEIDATDNITIDGSLRYDKGRVAGSFTEGTSTTYDINNDGEISIPEQSVYAVNTAYPTAVDYDYDYVSYSLGVNYKFQNRQSVFARYSRGASAKADRILFAGLDYLDGDKINALDFMNQAEVGYKLGLNNGAIYATAFYAKTSEEGGYEATSNSIIENDYKSMGLELEGFYNFGDAFNLRGALTWTDAEIDSGDNKGNTPRRQPSLIYNVIPAINFGSEKQHSGGLSFIGQTKSYTQDTNELVMPGFLIVNGFVNVGITNALNLNLSANNIFDSIAVTEAEEANITSGQVNYVRARTLPGRSITLGVQYKF